MLSWFSEKINQGWGIGEEEESQLGPLKAERVGCVFSVHVVVAVYGEVYLQNWLWPWMQLGALDVGCGHRSTGRNAGVYRVLLQSCLVVRTWLWIMCMESVQCRAEINLEIRKHYRNLFFFTYLFGEQDNSMIVLLEGSLKILSAPPMLISFLSNCCPLVSLSFFHKKVYPPECFSRCNWS